MSGIAGGEGRDALYGTSRASQVLPSGGLFDADPQEIFTGNRKSLALFLAYQQGQAAGAVTIRVEMAINPPDVGANQWGREIIQNNSVFLAGADVLTKIQRREWKYDPAGAMSEIAILFFDISQVQFFRTPCVESGVPGNPGTCAVYWGMRN